MFSILIPSWNNLPYLKLCIDSIRRHSTYAHEILVHVNDGTDGTIEWLKEQGIACSRSSENIGICMAVNHLAGMARHEWLLYMNDDMVCCPGWDAALADRIRSAEDDRLLLSSMLIEPTATGNDRVIVQNHGTGPDDFDADGLLARYRDTPRADMVGRASQPTLVARRWWLMVGGYSIEFSPGMSSDDDLLMKLWVAGFRRFEIVSASRLYHFACRSTGRIRKNRGSREFALKWGITQSEFMRNYIARSADPSGRLAADHLPHATPSGRLKRVAHGLLADIPLSDLAAWSPQATHTICHPNPMQPAKPTCREV